RTYAPTRRSPQDRFQKCRRGSDDLGQTFRRTIGGEFRRFNPARIVELVVENRLARKPSRGKTQDDEVTLDLALRVARDHLAVAGKRNRFYQERRLLAHLADSRLCERFSGFDNAPGQRVKVECRVSRAAHHQNLAIANDGGTDCEIGAHWISSLVGHAIYRFINLSTTSCGVGASFSSDSPLIIAPARAINGFNQPTAFPARAARVSGRRSLSSMAALVASSTIVIVTASVSRLLRKSGSALS